MKQLSISRILNTRIALVIICVNIILCVLYYFFSLQLAEQEFQTTLRRQTDHLVSTFTQQLWLFDLNTTERLAEMVYEDPQISGLRLIDHEGLLLIEYGDIDSTEPFFIHIDLMHDSGTMVGGLELVYNNINLETQRNDILVFSISISVVMIVLTLLLITIMIKRFLVRPLEELQEDMGVLGSGHFEPSDMRGHTAEIQAIIDDFNAMAIALKEREKERNQSEERQRKLENELRQKYKMEAVGIMAGGIAHNFNNNLAIILGNLELAQLKDGDNPKISNHLRDAGIAAHRARDLTKQILTYSRQGSVEHSPLKPAMIVDETVKLLRSTVPTTVELSCDISGKIAAVTINGDASRIQEALINLTNNAVQAMDESGQLKVGLTSTELTLGEMPSHTPCPPGRYVELSVRDNGCGMSEEVVERIFDPFYTTKEVNQGTGMGLSTVQGIVEQHNGFIKVDSRLGAGSTFKLYFPETATAAEQEIRIDEGILPRGTERILFVDDDALLTDLGEMLLSNQGYRVDTETDGRAALDLFRSTPQSFDLLITDQTMPRMTGLELISEIHEIRPDLAVILCTGYSSKASPEELEKHRVDAFCLKPLKMADLAQTVRSVLDTRSKR